MSIWVRSQSGFGLVEVNKLDVMSDEPNFFIRTYGNILGSYLTEDEAVKVLDLIEQRIMCIDDCRRNRQWVDIIFKMPPAGFSKEG